MAESKLAAIGAPQLAVYADQGMLKKLADRVEAVLATAINREPMCIDIDAILVAPRNRLGAPSKCVPHPLWDHQGCQAQWLVPNQAFGGNRDRVQKRQRETTFA